jgi:Fic family protein
LYAKSNLCTQEHIETAHRIITTHILPGHTQGKVRTGNMYVTTSDGRIEYVAASPYLVETEMDKFYADLKKLVAPRSP